MAYRLGDLDEARRAWCRAARSRPGHPEAVYNLAMLEWQQGIITDEQVLVELAAVRRAHLGAPTESAVALELVAHPERLHLDASGRLLRPLRPAEPTGALRPRCARTWITAAQRVPPSVAFPAQGATLLYVDDCRIVAVDLEDGSARELGRHARPVRAITVSCGGLRAASVDEERAVVWDLASFASLHAIDHSTRKFYDDGLVSVALTADGTRAFLGHRGGVKAWDVAKSTARSIAMPELGRPMLALCPGDDRLVVTDANDMLYVIDARHAHEAWHAGHSVPYHAAMVTPHTTEFGPEVPSYSTYPGPSAGGGGRCAAIPSRGSHAWCGNRDGTILIWELATGVLETTLKVPMAVERLALARGPDGTEQVLAFGVAREGDDPSLRCFSVGERRELSAAVLAGAGGVETLAVSADGRMVAVGSSRARVQLWHLDPVVDTSFFTPAVTSPPNERRAPAEAAQSPSRRLDGARALARLRGLWPAEPPVATTPEPATDTAAWAVAISDRYVAWAERNRARRGYAVRSATLQAPRASKLRSRHPIGAHSLAFLPDGRLVCAGKGFQVLDLTGRQDRTLLPRGSGTLACLAIERGRERALTGGMAGEGELWDLAERRCVALLRGHHNWITSAAFAGALGITGCGSAAPEFAVRLWDLAGFVPPEHGAAHLESCRVLQGHEKALVSLSVSRDETMLLSASLESLRLWRLPAGEELRCVARLPAVVQAAALSFCGRFAATVDQRGLLRVVELHSGDCVVEVKAHAGRAHAIAWSDDARFIVTGGENCGTREPAVKLWELDWQDE